MIVADTTNSGSARAPIASKVSQPVVESHLSESSENVAHGNGEFNGLDSSEAGEDAEASETISQATYGAKRKRNAMTRRRSKTLTCDA